MLFGCSGFYTHTQIHVMRICERMYDMYEEQYQRNRVFKQKKKVQSYLMTKTWSLLGIGRAFENCKMINGIGLSHSHLWSKHVTNVCMCVWLKQIDRKICLNTCYSLAKRRSISPKQNKATKKCPPILYDFFAIVVVVVFFISFYKNVKKVLYINC